jgi:hypothetical protein
MVLPSTKFPTHSKNQNIVQIETAEMAIFLLGRELETVFSPVDDKRKSIIVFAKVLYF